MSFENTQNRTWKLLVSIGSLIIAFYMIHARVLGFRVLGDESTHSIDIHRLLGGEPVHEFVYPNGQAYHSFVALLLKVLGLEYEAMNLLSPLIAGMSLTVVVLALYIIFRDEWGGGIGVIGIAAGLFSFSSFILMQSETSHKSFIFTLATLSFFLTWRIYGGGHDRRHVILVIGILSAIPFINALWGAIYSILFGVLLFLERFQSRHPRAFRASVVGGYLIPPTVTFLIHISYPHVDNALVFTIARLRNATGGDETVASSSSAAGGFIAGWPSVTIGDVTVSVWYVYTAGIFLIGLLTAFAFVIAGYRLVSEAQDRPIDRLLVFSLPIIGLILMALLAAGDLPTFRRMLAFPGALGLLYWMGLASSLDPVQLGEISLNIPLVILLIFICTSAVIATPRVMLDGDGTPYDFYANESDIDRVEWQITFEGDECPTTDNPQDRDLEPQLTGHRSVTVTDDPGWNSTIYDAGGGSVLYC